MEQEILEMWTERRIVTGARHIGDRAERRIGNGGLKI